MSLTVHLGDLQVDAAELADLCQRYGVTELSLFRSAVKWGPTVTLTSCLSSIPRFALGGDRSDQHFRGAEPAAPDVTNPLLLIWGEGELRLPVCAVLLRRWASTREDDFQPVIFQYSDFDRSATSERVRGRKARIRPPGSVDGRGMQP